MIPWSPLAKGRLARKPSKEQNETLRAQTDAIGKRFYSDEDFTIAQRVNDVAEARGLPMAQVALAWMLSKPVITAPIIGATKPHHLDDAVAALSIRFTPEEINHLEEAYQPHPVDGTALALAALALVCGLAATWRWPLHVVQGLDLTPSLHWPDPKLVITPDPEDGPVLITVEYRVPAERASDFVQAMEAMRSFRRKDGAVRWGLFRDLVDPDRYLETFLVPTWAEHMRQHARVTVADQAIEARAFAFQQPGVEPVAAHLIDARAVGGRTPAEPPRAELPIDT